jgi:methionine-rich copper-binding protein CopC
MRIAITLAAGLLALAAVTTVLAHASPERFEPAPGAVLDTAPERVDGWFTQDVRRQEDESFLRVYRVEADGSLGQRVDTDATIIDDDDRRHMSVDLTPDTGPGEYAVAWQTLSDEDDELDGDCYRFFVGQEAADAAHEARSRIDVAGKCPTAAVSAPPEATASIELDVPEESSTGDVTVGMTTEGATIQLPTGEGRDPAFAHYHLYLDIPPSLIHSHEEGEEGEVGMEDGEDGGGEMDMEQDAFSGDIMTVEDSYTFEDLEPGQHVVTAALFYDDHTPFNPPVMTGAAFRVTGSGGGDGGVDTWVLIVVGVAALAVGGGAALVLRRR